MRYAVLIALVLMPLTASFTNATECNWVKAANQNGDALSTFFDGLMPAQMNAFHLPGGVVSVVQDGRLVFA